MGGWNQNWGTCGYTGNPLLFSANLNDPVGMTRLLLSDLDSSNPIFPQDGMILGFLNMEEWSPKLAAALGMEVIAANRALTLQVIQLLDLKTDGLSTAKALLLAAAQIRLHANDDWPGIDFAQVVDDSDFAMREYYMKLIIQQNSVSY